MREHLLGYLLGALDDAEHERVRRQLEGDPYLVRDLERIQSHLAPLQAAREQLDAPPGLAERTCARLAELTSRPKPAPGGTVVAISPDPSAVRFTAADAVVAAGVVLAASFLFFPAIANSRHQAQVTACQNNLRQVSIALRSYSMKEDGQFPFVPARGNRAAAGIFGPTLADAQLLNESRLLLCPASSLAEHPDQFFVPSLSEVDQARGAHLARLRRTMGGSYGYCLGYQVDGRLRAVKDLGRNHFVLVADTPALPQAGGNSQNHAQRGQNVLYESGAVKYQRTCLAEVSGDDFFVSDRGRVEAGLNANDSVVGHSAAAPMP